MIETGWQIALPRIAWSGLLAQGRVDSLGNRFKNGGGELDWLTMLLVLVVLAIAVAVVWVVSRHLSRMESGGYHNHRGLFRELCRAHRLGWTDRRLLVLVARQQGVVVPARLFVQPERFEPERLASLREPQRRRAAALYELLFQADDNSGS